MSPDTVQTNPPRRGRKSWWLNAWYMYLVIPILRPLGVGFAHGVKQQISCLFGIPNNPQCSAWG